MGSMEQNREYLFRESGTICKAKMRAFGRLGIPRFKLLVLLHAV